MAAAALVAVGSPAWVGRFASGGAPPTPWRVIRIDKKIKPTTDRLITVAGVQDNLHPFGTPRRKSAFTNRAELIVAETGTMRAGTWVSA